MHSACILIALILGISPVTVADVTAGVPDVGAQDTDDDNADADNNELLQGNLRVERLNIHESADQNALQEAMIAQNHKIAILEKDCSNSNIQLAVQNAVQRAINDQSHKITTLEKAVSERDEELKAFKMRMQVERDEELKAFKMQMQEEHDEELKGFKMQMHEKMNRQEMKHEQLLREHRVTYGMLLQVCEKGLLRVMQSSANGTLVMDASKAKKQEWPGFVDDAVDWTKNAVNSVADTISDLPGDVADWSLSQLENLKSLVGLNWKDIPGLSGAINSVKDWAVDQAKSLVDAAMDAVNDVIQDIREFAVDAVNAALDTVKDWVSVIEKQVTKITDYVSDLYNTYLKPIITMIWDCAKSAKSPQDFVVCVIKPVLSKLFEALIPLGSVSEAIPFPFDTEAMQVDPDTGVYTMKQTCFDCQEDDIRDLAPLACEKKELNFLSIFKVTAHACNVPFMPGQCGGNLLTCVKKRASQCAKSAILWAPSGVLSRLSVPLNQAMQLGNTCVQSITEWSSAAHALHEKVKALENSSRDALKDILTRFRDAVDDAKDSKDSIVNCLKSVGDLASAGSASTMLRKVQKVITSVEEMIAAIERTQASVEAVQTSFENSVSSAHAEVQEFYTRVSADMQNLQNDIISIKEDLMQLYQNSKGVADDLIEDLQTALAAPAEQLENLGDMLQNCATARESYQRVYVDLEVATVTAGRLVLHERDGVKIAHLDPGRSEIYHEEWPWSSLASKEGATVDLCVFVYCCKFKMKLRKNPSNILGVPIQLNAGLDVLKWFELEYQEFSYNLNVIGVPFKFTDPTGFRLPSVTLPFLVDTSSPAQDPSNVPSDTLNVLWQQVVNNIGEAQQIADGEATAPSLPADAASANAIDQVKSEVDQGVDLDGTTPSMDFSGGIIINSKSDSMSGYSASLSQCDCGTRIAQWGSGKNTLRACAYECTQRANCASFGLWDNGHCALYDLTCPSKCSNPTVNPNSLYNKLPSDYSSAEISQCNCGTRIAQWGSGKDSLLKCADACTANVNCDSFGLWEHGHCALYDVKCVSPCTDPTVLFNTLYNKVPSGYSSANISQCDCGTRISQWGSGKDSLQLCADACTANVNCDSFGLWDGGHCALYDVTCGSTCSDPSKPTAFFNDLYNKVPSGYSSATVSHCDCGIRISQWGSGKENAQACADECTANENCLSFGLWDGGHCALYDVPCASTCENPTVYRNAIYNKAS